MFRTNWFGLRGKLTEGRIDQGIVLALRPSLICGVGAREKSGHATFKLLDFKAKTHNTSYDRNIVPIFNFRLNTKTTNTSDANTNT